MERAPYGRVWINNNSKPFPRGTFDMHFEHEHPITGHHLVIFQKYSVYLSSLRGKVVFQRAYDLQKDVVHRELVKPELYKDSMRISADQCPVKKEPYIPNTPHSDCFYSDFLPLTFSAETKISNPNLGDCMEEDKLPHVAKSEIMEKEGITGIMVEHMSRKRIFSIDNLVLTAYKPQQDEITFCFTDDNNNLTTATYKRSKIKLTRYKRDELKIDSSFPKLNNTTIEQNKTGT